SRLSLLPPRSALSKRLFTAGGPLMSEPVSNDQTTNSSPEEISPLPNPAEPALGPTQGGVAPLPLATPRGTDVPGGFWRWDNPGTDGMLMLVGVCLTACFLVGLWAVLEARNAPVTLAGKPHEPYNPDEAEGERPSLPASRSELQVYTGQIALAQA